MIGPDQLERGVHRADPLGANNAKDNMASAVSSFMAMSLTSEAHPLPHRAASFGDRLCCRQPTGAPRSVTPMLLHTPTLLLVLLLGFALLGVQLWLTRSATCCPARAAPRGVAVLELDDGLWLLSGGDWMPRDVAGLLGILALAAGVTCFTAAVFQHVLQRLPPRPITARPDGLARAGQPGSGRRGAHGGVPPGARGAAAAAHLVALRHGWHNEVSFRIVGGTLCVTLLGLAWRALDAWWHPR